MSYQGILRASEGDTVVSDGIHPMRFYLFDAQEGGNLLWQQPPLGQGSQSVETKKGLFTVILGSYAEAENDLLREVINDNPDNRWLEIEAYGEILTPRFRLFSNPYAYRSIVADSSQKAITSIYADTSFNSWNSNTLGNLDRDGFVEEGEPDVINGSMIIDGSIMAEDIGFSGFHQAKQAYASNNFYQSATISWQDINDLYLEIDVEGDSALTYVSLSIQRVLLPRPTVEVRISVDNLEITSGEYSLNYDTGWPVVVSSININKIVILSTGHHVIKGQFRRQDGTYFQTLQGRERNLIAIILK